MRVLAVVLLVLIPLAGVSYFISHKSVSRTQEYIESFEPGTVFDIKSRNGEVQVVADSHLKEIVIEATYRAVGSSDDEAKRRLDFFDLFLERENDTTQVIHAIFPDDMKPSDACSLIIHTPGGSIGTIRSSNGGITTKGISGPGSVDTSNGSILVQDSGAGELKLSSANGSIKVDGAAGSVDADTRNGNIDVMLTDHARGTLKLNTSNGKVFADLPVAMGGRITAKTSNGRVKIENGILASSVKAKKSKASIVLSKNGMQSSITSSNGQIKIKLR